MQIIYFIKILELKRAKSELEKALGVRIEIAGRKVVVRGEPLNEYDASFIFEAINFGFSAQKALSLRDENMVFRIVNIKQFTRKKNLREVRARLIGTRGRTKKTIENISNSNIVINDNDIGVIARADEIEEIITAITSLIRGAKQANTYRFLERMNRAKKNELKN